MTPLGCCVRLRAPRTYPRPSKRQELPFRPVVTFDVEETSNHDEDPDCQVNDVEHVVQPHRVLHPHGHDDGDNDSNDQSKKVRVRLLSFPWVKEKSCVTLHPQLWTTSPETLWGLFRP